MIARSPLPFACLAMFASACIIAAPGDGDEDSDDTYDDGYDDNGYEDTGTVDGTTGEPEEDESSSSGGDDGDLVCDDPTELVEDPSFETTTEDDSWTQQTEVFEEVVCDETCTDEAGAEPYAGERWVWFGGHEEAEDASISQDIEISGDEATLSFYFAISASGGSGDDTFSVYLDDTELFVATDTEIDDYADYQRIDVDVSDFADGEVHTLTFEASLSGAGMTNFFLDEVSLTACDPDEPSSDDGSDSSSTGDDESSTGDGTDTGSSSTGDDTEGDDTEGETDDTEGETGEDESSSSG
jgi:hypothetical protein